jgi:hypothetical protein
MLSDIFRAFDELLHPTLFGDGHASHKKTTHRV